MEEIKLLKFTTISTAESIREKLNVFNGKHPGLNVLLPETIEHFCSRLPSQGTFEPLPTILKIAVNAPYIDPRQNYGVIDCLYSTGQLLNSPRSVEFLMGTYMQPLIKPTGRYAPWSLKEEHYLLELVELKNTVERHKNAFPHRSSQAIKKRIKILEEGKDKTNWAAPIRTTKIPLPKGHPILCEYKMLRHPSEMIEELDVLESLISMGFSSTRELLNNLNEEAIFDRNIFSHVEVLTDIEVDCLFFREFIWGKVFNTYEPFGAAYPRRELIVIHLIGDYVTSQGGNANDIAAFYQQILGNIPGNMRTGDKAAAKYAMGYCIPGVAWKGADTKEEEPERTVFKLEDKALELRVSELEEKVKSLEQCISSLDNRTMGLYRLGAV